MENLINSIEKKFMQQCSERDSRSYETLYFSFPEELHLVETPPKSRTAFEYQRRYQGWISDMGIDGPTFVPKSGYFLLIWIEVCPQKLAFS